MTRSDARRLFVETFGCQMNFLDSELVIGRFRRLGYELTRQRDRADLIVLNTCSVRDHAEQRVNGRLVHLRRLKARRPDAIVAVVGCQAEREGAALFERFEHVDIVCGPGELDRLPELVAQIEASRAAIGGSPADREAEPCRALALSGFESRRRSATAGDAADRIESLDMSRWVDPGQGPLQAYVRAQRGCDKFCAFCVVPRVRGRERCRPPENIVAEIERLAQAGCREVTLLGQTVNSYRRSDAAGRLVTFARLLERAAAIDGLLRVRFVTSYPGDFDEDILRVMADVPKVCPYLHIPAQSGSDRVLRAMKRRYTAADYFRLIDRARELAPGLALAGDFIVGFPGETDADFAATAEMVRRVRYKNCYIFKYSPRPGTAAFERLPDDVPDSVKRRRNQELLAVQAEVGAQLNAELVGRTVSVLVEGFSKMAKSRGESADPPAPADVSNAPKTVSDTVFRPAVNMAEPLQLTGRTVADQIVVFDRPIDLAASRLVGQLADVRVVAVTPYTLLGRLASTPDSLAANDRQSLPLRYKSLTTLQS